LGGCEKKNQKKEIDLGQTAVSYKKRKKNQAAREKEQWRLLIKHSAMREDPE